MKRMRLIPDETNIDFFKHAKLTFGASCVAVVLALAVWFTMGLNYGIDFRGGTTLRTQSETAVDVAAYRAAMEPLGLGDVSICTKPPLRLVLSAATDKPRTLSADVVVAKVQVGERRALREQRRQPPQALSSYAVSSLPSQPQGR